MTVNEYRKKLIDLLHQMGVEHKFNLDQTIGVLETLKLAVFITGTGLNNIPTEEDLTSQE